jgi:serine/threonine-protein kinase RsbW
VKIEIGLCLPRDATTVALVRDVAMGALSKLGVADGDIDDIRLALSEACTNVIRHSGSDDEYEVRMDITEDRCEIRVIDSGRGLDFAAAQRGMPGPTSPGGRGLAIIGSVSDSAEFISEPEAGTMVHLVKRLHHQRGGPIDRLLHSQQTPPGTG